MTDWRLPERRRGIYALVNRRTGDAYVGSSLDVAKRVLHHRRQLDWGSHWNQRLQRAWRKYGAETFFPVLLATVASGDLLAVEQYFIDLIGSYNLIPAGAVPSFRGGRQTDETRARIGAANRGRKRSQETRERISRARKGIYKTSPEAAAKIAAANRGKRRSEEARANYRAAWTPERRAKQAAVARRVAAARRGRP